MTNKKRSFIVSITAIMLVAAFVFHVFNLSTLKNIFLLASTFIAGIPIMIKALQSARMKVFSIELLVTIAVIGAIFIGEYIESAAVTFLFLFGAFLETRTFEKTRSSLKSLMDLAPLEAKVVRNEQTIILPLNDLRKGDRVLIQSGDKVAVDGKVISGEAFINEAAITGESVPVKKSTENHVFTGTIVDNGYIEVIAEKVGEDTTFAKIIELVEEAQESKAKTQKFIEKFAQFYTPAIVIFSIIVLFITKDIELTLTFLVIACPGALVISAPVSIVAGIGNGAKNGILLKGGEIIENFACADAVIFDKTGTLTKGQPEVTSIFTYTMQENDFLQLAAAAETVSEHHLGRTIVQEAIKRNLPVNVKPTEAEIIKGMGITGMINEQTFAIGNRKLMHGKEIYISREIERAALKNERLGNTVIFAAFNNEICGIISIADQIRSEAKETIKNLKTDGIKKVIMLTGDNHLTAALVGNQLGFDYIMAEMLPEDKVVKLKEFQQAGYRVAMVGDGINDAPAIAAADIGIAMGGAGTDVAMETADVVLVSDRLDRLPQARKLAKSTVRNMKQNTYFAVGTVLLLLAGVLFKKVFLASGMLIHELSVLIVIVNALRLVRYNKDKK